MYHYKCEVIRVIDGDTFVGRIDLGFGVSITETFRLYGINAPETSGESRQAGIASEFALYGRIVGIEIEVKTHKTRKGDDKRGKYGRYLAEVFLPGETQSVNDWLVENGHAKKVSY